MIISEDKNGRRASIAFDNSYEAHCLKLPVASGLRHRPLARYAFMKTIEARSSDDFWYVFPYGYPTVDVRINHLELVSLAAGMQVQQVEERAKERGFGVLADGFEIIALQRAIDAINTYRSETPRQSPIEM